MCTVIFRLSKKDKLGNTPTMHACMCVCACVHAYMLLPRSAPQYRVRVCPVRQDLGFLEPFVLP